MGGQRKRFNTYRKYGGMRRMIKKFLWPADFVETDEMKLWRRSQRGKKIKSIAQLKRIIKSKCEMPEREVRINYWPNDFE